MDAHLKKITITPAKFDKEGEIKENEFATVTLDVPMDSLTQRAFIKELLELLDQQDVYVDISGEPTQKVEKKIA